MVADFETTPLDDDGFTRVWCWAMADVSSAPHTTFGLSIDDFMGDIARFDSTMWFHNLNFDGGFIMDWLLRNNYELVEEYPTKGQWTVLMSYTNNLYQIQVVWPSGHTTKFQDSYKKIAMGVARVAKTFNLDEGKGDIDHTIQRPPGYEPTPAEWDYVRRDVEIMAKAMVERLKDGSKLTSSADALTHYKKLVGSSWFKSTFPVLNPDADSTVRLAYRGGFTYVNPRYQHIRCGPGHVYDVNSLYPAMMYHKPLPYGLPKLFNGEPPAVDGVSEVFVCSITFTARVKPDHVPTIQLKNNPRFRGAEYIEHIADPATMMVTNVDLALMMDHYDVQILSYNGGLVFQATTGLFDDYIEYWSHVKEHSEDGAREIAKLFLNSLYGKFGTNPDVTPRIPYIKEETNALGFVDGAEETRDPVYTPIAVFVTSYGRDTTIRAAQEHFDRFMYADTDSLHLYGDGPVDLPTDNVKMGYWDHEYRFTDSTFLRAKQYGELPDGADAPIIRIAGAPSTITETMTLDDMVIGRTFYGKLQRTYVPGGIVLQPTTFTLK